MATSSPIPLPVYNPTADDIPPGGAMEPTGVTDADGRITVQKPTVSDSLAVLINGPSPILAGDSGSGFLPWVGPLAIAVDPTLLDSDGALITPATTFGVQSGNWYFTSASGRKGFVTQGDVFGGLIPAQAVPTTSAGVEYWFAQLTSGSSPYSWQERVETSAGVWANGARSGATNAYQAQPSAGTPSAPATNDVVLMRASAAVAGKYEFVLADKAGGAIPLSYAAVLSTGSVAVNSTSTTILTLNLAAGKWLMMYNLTARLQTTNPGDIISCVMIISAGTGTLDTNAAFYPCCVQVSGAVCYGGGAGQAHVELTTAGTMSLTARRTSSGTVTLSEVLLGASIRAVPANF